MQLTIQDALKKGIQAHKSGNLREADLYYTAILDKNPNHPDANHNMGVLAIGLGKLEEAIVFFEKALNVNSGIFQFWYSYLEAMLKLGKLTEVRKTLDNVKNSKLKLSDRERLTDVFENLIAEVDKVEKKQKISQKDLEQLLTLYNRAEFQEVVQQAQKFEKENIISVDLYNIIGAAFAGLKNYNTALEFYKKALAIDPDFAEANNNIGNALRSLGNNAEAILYYKKALSVDCNVALVHTNLGNAILAIGENIDAAIESFKTAIRLQPRSADFQNNLGNAYIFKGEPQKAKVCFTEAIRLNPKFAGAHNNLGNLYQEFGDISKAKKHYISALKINPNMAEAYRHFSNLIKFNSKTPQLKKMLNVEKTTSLSQVELCHLKFAIAKAFEDLEEYELSFRYYVEGNTLRKKLIKYEITQDIWLFEKLKTDQPYFDRLRLKIKNDSLIPIFLVGMPRSGTTLIEQILSCHSKVTGAGELEHVNNFCKKLYTKNIELNINEMKSFREFYLQKISELSNGKPLVTDKMPQNFRYLPIIFSLFPEAKVIHIKRDPKATCWSNFKHYFSTEGLGYSYNLNDLVQYFKMYEKLMDLWEKKYPGKIISCDYEAVTVNPKKIIRQLLEPLELSWEKTLLEPQENKRNVRTASQQQVRKKIYSGSSEVWKRYEPFLGGVFSEL